MTGEKNTELEQAHNIASMFDLPQPLECSDFPGKGNINQQTYLITAGHGAEYLLQLLNPKIFTRPEAVMSSMVACIRAQERALSEGALGPGTEWEVIRLVKTKTGADYLSAVDETGTKCWRMMARMADTKSYRSLQEIAGRDARLRIAEEAGRGLAVFGTLTSGMDVSQAGSPLPGYRDTRLYYSQLLSILSGNRMPAEAENYLPADPLVRQSSAKHFLVQLEPEAYRRRLEDPQLRRIISMALDYKEFGLTLAGKLESGELKKVVIHGDTKLENFLFSNSTGRVKALVDLDTIMPHTWLSDWGDMVRSLVNIAGEREENPERIAVDMEVFRALARGFLGSARHVEDHEINLMVDAPQIIALELGVRFLADYLRGDNYFKIGPGDPPDLNKIRAIVQFCVFERLRDNEALARHHLNS